MIKSTLRLYLPYYLKFARHEINAIWQNRVDIIMREFSKRVKLFNISASYFQTKLILWSSFNIQNKRFCSSSKNKGIYANDAKNVNKDSPIACQKHTLVGRYYKTGRGSPYWINCIARSICLTVSLSKTFVWICCMTPSICLCVCLSKT